MKDNSAIRKTKDALFEQFARIGHALGSPKRIELIELLDQAPKNVEQLSREADLPLKSTSAHLRVLREARLVATRRTGKHIIYRLADPEVSVLAQSMVGVARARLGEVEQIARAFLADRDTLQPVTIGELKRLVRQEEVVLIDVRPAEEFLAGHIQGARSIPLADLPRALTRLPRNREIIAYCRGPYCVLAPQAVALLRRRGFQARRLDAGYPEARAAGIAISA